MALLVSDFKGTELRVFFFRRPTQAAISKADDDENDADDRGRFHWSELTADAGLGSN